MSEPTFLAAWMPHLMLAPILLPLLSAALMLLLPEEKHRTKLVMNLGSTLLGLVIACALLVWAHQQGEPVQRQRNAKRCRPVAGQIHAHAGRCPVRLGALV